MTIAAGVKPMAVSNLAHTAQLPEASIDRAGPEAGAHLALVDGPAGVLARKRAAETMGERGRKIVARQRKIVLRSHRETSASLLKIFEKTQLQHEGALLNLEAVAQASHSRAAHHPPEFLERGPSLGAKKKTDGVAEETLTTFPAISSRTNERHPPRVSNLYESDEFFYPAVFAIGLLPVVLTAAVLFGR
ncbi:hypothetical protein QIH77_03035 [Bradyrhizobium diazoefficiens]|uniref:hypothetical protein n=1 Tax=Bradyrhizobium diazoefficiens TaxID=1355477 RepID=UPI00272A7DCB|nr:hypothetical protein [Bradyrhizobium diazoefficiens]WLA74226.1 hypothetical protein QIH77_03035 [Bradyrhizobium diazoefficiens]